MQCLRLLRPQAPLDARRAGRDATALLISVANDRLTGRPCGRMATYDIAFPL